MKKRKKRVCSIKGCGREVEARGLCDAHYRRQRTGSLRPNDPIRLRNNGGGSGTCRIKGCGRAAHTRKLCASHYARHLKYGNIFEDIPIQEQMGCLALPEKARRIALGDALRVCSACKQVKPKTAFSPKERYYCRQCTRKRWLKSRLGVTPADYQYMLAEQDGQCALCGTSQPGGNGKHFAIDHDHQTGAIRGLLCQACNRYVVGVIEQRNISIDRLRDYLNGAYALKR